MSRPLWQRSEMQKGPWGKRAIKYSINSDKTPTGLAAVIEGNKIYKIDAKFKKKVEKWSQICNVTGFLLLQWKAAVKMLSIQCHCHPLWTSWAFWRVCSNVEFPTAKCVPVCLLWMGITHGEASANFEQVWKAFQRFEKSWLHGVVWRKCCTTATSILLHLTFILSSFFSLPLWSVTSIFLTPKSAPVQTLTCSIKFVHLDLLCLCVFFCRCIVFFFCNFFLRCYFTFDCSFFVFVFFPLKCLYYPTFLFFHKTKRKTWFLAV